MRLAKVSAAVILSCVAAISVVHAQSTGASLSGTVHDVSRAVLPDAAIVVRNRATALTRTTTSNLSGSFRITALVPGEYDITIERAGFASTRIPITLLLGEDYVVEVALPLAYQEKVNIPPQHASIDTSATALSRRIAGREISTLPVQGRLFQVLAPLTPGILNSYNTAANGSGFAAAGQTGRNNEMLVDGLTLDDVNSSSPRGSLPLDAVQDFVVISNAPTAEFGHASGAVVNVLSKSGSNTFRGLAFVYWEDGAWNGTPGSALLAQRPKPDFRQTIAGGSSGGPISRDHAFFFGSVEYTDWNSEFIVTSPVARTLAPDEPPSMPQRSYQPQVLGRVDLNLHGASTLGVRYRLDRTSIKGRMGVNDMNFGTPSRGHDSVRRDDDVAVVSTQVLRRGLLNEVRAQLARRYIHFDPTGYCAGCPSIEYPHLFLGKNTGVPNLRQETRWQIVDALTAERSGWAGSHTFKTGLDVSFIGVDFDQPGNRDGTYKFPSDLPFDERDPATYPDTYTRTDGNSFIHVDDTVTAFFVQDRWVPASGLTLNLGIRWDYERSPGVSGDTDNVAPRIGVAIDPWHTGKTSIRSSYGIYYDQVFLTIARMGLQAQTASSISVSNPGYQGDLKHPNDPYGFNPNGPARTLRVLNTASLANLETPYTEQASVGIQRALGSTTSLAVDAVWARGQRLLMTRDLNYPDLSRPILVGQKIHPRPDPDLGQITTVDATGHSWYRGLQIGFLKAPSRGFGYSVAYTLSVSERDTEDSDFVPQDQRDYGADRGPTLNDARHRLAGTLSLDLPFALHLGTVVTARSALPYNVIVGPDVNGDGNGNTDRPPGVGRNSGRGSSFVEGDLRLSRTFGRGDRHVELIVEAFNVTNRQNWTYPPNRVFSTPARPSGAEIPRQLQVGLRALF